MLDSTSPLAVSSRRQQPTTCGITTCLFVGAFVAIVSQPLAHLISWWDLRDVRLLAPDALGHTLSVDSLYRIDGKVQRVQWWPDQPFADWITRQRPRHPIVLTNTLASVKWCQKMGQSEDMNYFAASTKSKGGTKWSPEWLTARLHSKIPNIRVGTSPIFQYFNEELRSKTASLYARAAGGFNASWPRSEHQTLSIAEFWDAVAQQSQTGKYLLLATPLLAESVEIKNSSDRFHAELAQLVAAELRGYRLWTMPKSVLSTHDTIGDANSDADKPADLPTISLATALGGDTALGGGISHARPGHWQLWMAGGGVTSQPHYDQQHNIYVQLHGTKRFLLSPPSEARRMELFPRIHGAMRHSGIDFVGDPTPPSTRPARTPTPRDTRRGTEPELQLRALEVTLNPGEVLYIPPWWVHLVEAVAAEKGDSAGSVSMSSWFPDNITVSTLSASAALPLPVAVGSVRTDFSTLTSTRSALDTHTITEIVAFLWAHIEGGLGGIATVRELLDQRYRPTYGPLSYADVAKWQTHCSSATREAAARRPGLSAWFESIRRFSQQKSAVFAEMERNFTRTTGFENDFIDTLPTSLRLETQAQDMAALMMADEVELTVGLVLGDSDVYNFLAGCVAADSGEGLHFVTTRVLT